MISGLSLVNFKCHNNLSIDLPALTLLSGFNAGGKTSSMQGLLLVSQKLREDPDGAKLSLSGRLVQLGSFSDLLGDLELERPKFQIGAHTKDIKIEWVLTQDEDNENSRAVISEIRKTTGNVTVSHKIRPSSAKGLMPARISNEAASNLIKDIRELSVIGALRSSGRELYPTPKVSEPLRGWVGIAGELAPWWFAKLLDDDIDPERMCSNDPAKTLRRQVNAWGQSLFGGFEANAAIIANSDFVQLEFRTSEREVYRRPENVGYGLSYAFPIIVACLIARKGQTIYIDSPEAHLHPAAQSMMGQFLAVTAAAGVQVIIETHSDHVLNGVRLSIKKGILPSDSAAVYFFDRNALSSTNQLYEERRGVNPVKTIIDPRGRLKHWPTGFFDQIETDLAQL
ncbi:atpase exported protein [Methylobacterium sp. GXF4]|uniref:AAA family ATPase n=1 Tax=Methylobacterium sp. GXF4 TaxID=1096546 RepID=UPI0002697C6B|nr:DUF3696 domain-containing protein [Methylobacterium sp. GXF4]EIZ85452.1 atpase exported protein [Methylobacterium sp. GXF4]